MSFCYCSVQWVLDIFDWSSSSRMFVPLCHKPLNIFVCTKCSVAKAYTLRLATVEYMYILSIYICILCYIHLHKHSMGKNGANYYMTFCFDFYMFWRGRETMSLSKRRLNALLRTWTEHTSCRILLVEYCSTNQCDELSGIVLAGTHKSIIVTITMPVRVKEYIFL